MDTPLISVIVPVYKVEEYLDQCVGSIVDQTYRNLEIILVDDGSPDNCPAMCDDWAAKDNRVRVIHKQNGGLSDARNAGMEIASGELIGFVDSDDFITQDMYQRLWERMMADGSDIASCGVQMVWDDGTEPRLLTGAGEAVLNNLEAMEAILRESWLKQPVWHKLYKTSLIRDILFPVGKHHEDVFWSYRAVAQACRVSILEKPCYFYRQRRGSIMGEGYSMKRLDAIEAKRQRMEFVCMQYQELESLAQTDLLFACMYHGQLSMKYLPEVQKKKTLQWLREIVAGAPVCTNELSLTHKCWVWLAKQNFVLCCKVRNLLGVGL